MQESSQGKYSEVVDNVVKRQNITLVIEIDTTMKGAQALFSDISS